MIELFGFWGLALVAAKLADDAEQKNKTALCIVLVLVAATLGLVGAGFAFVEMLGK